MIPKNSKNPVHARSSGVSIGSIWKVALLVGGGLFAVAVLFYMFNAIETIQEADEGVLSQYGDPSNYVAYRRFLSNDSNARCLDGSNAAYYIRKGRGGGEKQWLVFFEGGGWCFDIQSCIMRAKTRLGTSEQYPEFLRRGQLQDYLSGDLVDNPMMYNWNLVYVRYCDGGSFAGDNEIKRDTFHLHFRGKAIREETIRTLLASEGMGQAENVVIGGCSAGALAVLLGIDQIAQQIRYTNPSTSVRGLVDSGFFLDWTSNYKLELKRSWLARDDASVEGYMDYANAMRNVFTFMNIASGANQGCVVSVAYTENSKVKVDADRRRNFRRLQANNQNTIQKNVVSGVEVTKTQPVSQKSAPAIGSKSAPASAGTAAASKGAPAKSTPASTGAALVSKGAPAKSTPASAGTAVASKGAPAKSTPASAGTAVVSKDAPAKSAPASAGTAAASKGAPAKSTPASAGTAVVSKDAPAKSASASAGTAVASKGAPARSTPASTGTAVVSKDAPAKSTPASNGTAAASKGAPAKSAPASTSTVAASKSAPASTGTAVVSKSAPSFTGTTAASKGAPLSSGMSSSKRASAAFTPSSLDTYRDTSHEGIPVKHHIAADCIFAKNLGPHVKTPLFILQPRYDSWQILHIFSKAFNNKGVNAYGNRLVRELKEAFHYNHHPGHGVFIDSCSHHCTGCSSPLENTWSGFRLVSDDGFNPSNAFAAWYINSVQQSTTQHGQQSESMKRLLESMATTTNVTITSPQGGHKSVVLNTSTSGLWFIQEKSFPCDDCCLCRLR